MESNNLGCTSTLDTESASIYEEVVIAECNENLSEAKDIPAYEEIVQAYNGQFYIINANKR